MRFILFFSFFFPLPTVSNLSAKDLRNIKSNWYGPNSMSTNGVSTVMNYQPDMVRRRIMFVDMQSLHFSPSPCDLGGVFLEPASFPSNSKVTSRQEPPELSLVFRELMPLASD